MFKKCVCCVFITLAFLSFTSVSYAAEQGVAVSTLYTDTGADTTHFRTDTIEWVANPSNPDASAAVAAMTELSPATQLGFVRVPAGYRSDWHPAPRKQYVMVLSGKLEVEAGDGERREFTPGTVLLVTDVDGRGHKTNALGTDDVFLVWVPVP